MASPVVYLSRKLTFSAGHRLHTDKLTDEENKTLFRACNRSHGHNYTVKVTLRGPVDQRTGMLINVLDLKAYMQQCIMEPLDHKHLDQDVPYFKEKVSTVENILLFIWDGMKDVLPDPKLLFEVKISETDNSMAYYRGE